jgi:hypothetical protein
MRLTLMRMLETYDIQSTYIIIKAVRIIYYGMHLSLSFKGRKVYYKTNHNSKATIIGTQVLRVVHVQIMCTIHKNTFPVRYMVLCYVQHK